MPLIACKDCGEPMSTDAKKCPKCGAKPPYRWTLGRMVVAGFILLVVAIAVFSPSSPEDQAARAERMDSASAQVACERAVREQLKAPSTAEFSEQRYGKGEQPGRWLVAGAVDAQNSFGAKLRNQWQCAVDVAGDTTTVVHVQVK